MIEDQMLWFVWLLACSLPIFPIAFTYCASKKYKSQPDLRNADDPQIGFMPTQDVRPAGANNGSTIAIKKMSSTNLDKHGAETTQLQFTAADPFDPNYQTLKGIGVELGQTEKMPLQSFGGKKEVMRSPFDPNYQTLKCDGADLGKTEVAPVDTRKKIVTKSPFDPNYATLNIKGGDLGRTERAPQETGPKKIVAKSPFDPNYATLNIKGADLGRTERAPQEPKGTKKPKMVSPFDPQYATLNLKAADLGATEAVPAPTRTRTASKINLTKKRK